MIPVLYDAGERDFTSNGLGRLYDAISCTVTEERNGSFELEMTYPVSGIHYKDILKERIIFAVPADGKKEQPFRIYKISKPMKGITTILARHVTYQLSFIPVKADLTPATTAAQAFERLKHDAIEPCGFDFWTDDTTVGNYTTPLPASLRSRLGGVEGSILDNFGGEYEWDRWTVKLHAARGRDSGKVIRYGKDLTDLKQEESIENTVTGVVPYWAKANDGETQLVTASPVYTENASKFPYRRTVVLDLSSEWQEAPSESALRDKAASYMKANGYGVPSVNISISFVALWQSEEYRNIAPLERVNLCDTVSVEFPELSVSAKAKVIKTVYDVLKDRYSSIEIGSARATLSDSIASQNARIESQEKSNRAFLESAIRHATKLISGGLGGHVVFGLNADGQPDEILIMDTADKNTAVNVLRINMNGIGFSTSGYQGPFDTAWTIDSRFYADFITAGTLNGNLIKAGTITDKKGRNYWNMETGEFRLSSNTWIGEKTFTDQYQAILAEAQSKAEEIADEKTRAASATWSQQLEQQTDGKIATYLQDKEPSGDKLDVGDIWFDSSNGYTAYRYDGKTWVKVKDSGIARALQDAADAMRKADTKNTVTGGDIAPVNPVAGDMWIDSGHDNAPMIYDGSKWVSYRDETIAGSLASAKTYTDEKAREASGEWSKALAEQTDGKIATFLQESEPTGDKLDKGDIWFDSSDGYTAYRYDGSAWVKVKDAGIAQALKDAASAMKKANTKNTITGGDTAPANPVSGDMWIDSGHDNQPMIYSGSKWISYRDSTIASSLTAAKAYADEKTKAASDTWSKELASQIDGKIATYMQEEAPDGDGLDVGDIWFDSSNGYTAYRYNGQAWIKVKDAGIAQALQDAANAMNKANTKNTITGGKTAPSNPVTGDMWIDSGNDNKPMIYNGTQWISYRDATIASSLTAAKAYADTINKSLNQTEIFNRLTDNGSLEGIYMENGKLYINGSYIKSGTITADLIKAGIIKVQTSDGAEEIDLGDNIKMTNAGIEVKTVWGNYIEIKPGVFNGISFTGDGEAGTGEAVGIAKEGILIKNNSDKLLGNFNMQYPSTHINYNSIAISDAFMGNRYVRLSADSSDSYAISARGNFTCTGSKSRLVDTADYGQRLLYCYETPSPLFGDVGEGVIASDGVAYVFIDSILSETIATAQYQVFLQAYGSGTCFIKERRSAYFIVEGTPGLQFGWELKAKQSDFTQTRLNQFYDSKPKRDQVDYGQEAVDHITELSKERAV